MTNLNWELKGLGAKTFFDRFEKIQFLLYYISLIQ